MLVARRVLVSGRVQGIGFRFFVDETARYEGVSGWVRNLPDGRLEAFIEGDEESVVRVVQKVQRGPRGARVDHVDVRGETPTGVRREFEIR